MGKPWLCTSRIASTSLGCRSPLTVHRASAVTDPEGQKDHRIIVLGGYKLVTQSRPYTAAIATGSEQGIVCCIELALIKLNTPAPACRGFSPKFAAFDWPNARATITRWDARRVRGISGRPWRERLGT